MKRGPEKQFPERFELRLDASLLERLRKAAERQGISIGELLRRAAVKIAA